MAVGGVEVDKHMTGTLEIVEVEDRGKVDLMEDMGG